MNCLKWLNVAGIKKNIKAAARYDHYGNNTSASVTPWQVNKKQTEKKSVAVQKLKVRSYKFLNCKQ